MFGWFKRKKQGGEPAPTGPTVKVRFEDDGVTLTAQQGASLPDVCDDHGLSLGFGCREGGCGTCMIEVISGMENLPTPEPNEREMLDIMAEGNPNARLACQCVVNGDLAFRALEG